MVWALDPSSKIINKTFVLYRKNSIHIYVKKLDFHLFRKKEKTVKDKEKIHLHKN